MRAAVVLVACVGIAACTAPIDVTASRSDQTRAAVPDSDTSRTTAPVIDDPGASTSVDPGATTSSPSTAAADGPLTPQDVEEILVELEAAGFCDPDDVRDDGIVTAMHFVVDGQLQAPCYVDQPDDGDDVSEVVLDDDPRLIQAWDSLVAVTPPNLVDDISLLAGFEPCATCDTLAFVTTLDTDASFFLLAVDVVSGATDPDELRLTMMHELTHVFAQEPGTQLTLVADPDDCPTFYNGVGCFTEDSYLWAWIEEFWPTDIRDTLPPDGSVGSDEEAAARCDVDPAYTGSYAAVHPEEDFAETFSAYVYDVELDPALAPKLTFFDRYPEFVEIRENVREAGLSGIVGSFGGCG